MLCLSRAGFMLYVIERAKKCLDFAATLYIIHLFICIVYGGWPASVTWWVLNITGLATMALLGEYLCIRRELKEIPISRLRASKYFIHIKNLFISFGFFVCTCRCRLHSNVFAYLVSLTYFSVCKSLVQEEFYIELKVNIRLQWTLKQWTCYIFNKVTFHHFSSKINFAT
jgi:hypothetical protein